MDKDYVIAIAAIGLAYFSFGLLRACITGKVDDVLTIRRAANPVWFWIYCILTGAAVLACIDMLYSAFA